MRKRIRTFDGTELSITVPYTHMGYKDACNFYGAMNALLTYANQMMRLVPEEKIVIDGPDRRRQALGSFVSEKLWENRELVDAFVRTNPLGVSERQLGIVRPWKHAVHDLFICVYADADCALYMNDTQVFAVGSMEQPAGDFVHSIPSLTALTLLPYKGGIVTDGKVLHVCDEPRAVALPILKQDSRRALGRGVICDAHALAVYERRSHGRSWMSPAVKECLDEYLAQLVAAALGV